MSRSRRKGGSASKRRTPKHRRIRKRSIMRGGTEPVSEPSSGEVIVPPDSKTTSVTTQANMEGAQHQEEAFKVAAIEAKQAVQNAQSRPIPLDPDFAGAIINVEPLCVVCNPMDSGAYAGEIHQLSFPGTVVLITGPDTVKETQARLLIYRDIDPTSYGTGTTYKARIVDAEDAEGGVFKGGRIGTIPGSVRCEKRSWRKLPSSSSVTQFYIDGFLCGGNRTPRVNIGITKSNPNKLSVIFTHFHGGVEFTEKIYFTPDQAVLSKILRRDDPFRQEFSRGPSSVGLVPAVFQPIFDSLEKLDPIMVSNNNRNLRNNAETAQMRLAIIHDNVRIISECYRGGHRFVDYKPISSKGSYSQGKVIGQYLGAMGVENMYEQEHSPAEYSHRLSCSCGCRELYIRGTDKDDALRKFNEAVEIDMDSVGLQAAKQRLAFALGTQYELSPLLICHLTTLTNRNSLSPSMEGVPRPPHSINPSYILLKSCLSDIRYNTCLHTEGHLVEQRVMVGDEDFEEAIGYMEQLSSGGLTAEQIITGLTIFMVTVKKVKGLFAVYSRLCNTADEFNALFPPSAEGTPTLGLGVSQTDTIQLYSHAFQQCNEFCGYLRQGKNGNSRELWCLEWVIHMLHNQLFAPANPSETHSVSELNILRATCLGLEFPHNSIEIALQRHDAAVAEKVDMLTELAERAEPDKRAELAELNRRLEPKKFHEDIFDGIEGSYVSLRDLYRMMIDPDREMARRKRAAEAKAEAASAEAEAEGGVEAASAEEEAGDREVNLGELRKLRLERVDPSIKV